MWAATRGLPYFIHPYRTGCSPSGACDAYAPRAAAVGAPWEHYFEPVGNVSLAERYERGGAHAVAEADVVEMTCDAASFYYMADIYPANNKEAWSSRAMNAALVAAWLRVQPPLRWAADAQWRCHVLREWDACAAASGGTSPTPEAVASWRTRG